MNAAGDFVIAWYSSGQDGSGDGIYAQRYNSVGAPQGAEFRVNTFTTNNQSFPVAAMDADGDFAIAWSDYGGQDGSSAGVFAQRYDAAGVPLGAEFQVNTYTTNNQASPCLSMDADGDFVIAWESRNGQDGSSYGVYAQRYDAAGVPQGSEFRVNTYTTNMQWDPSVTMDSDGDFVIVWTSHSQDGDWHGIYAQRYNSAGEAQGSEFRVNSYTSSAQWYPSVAMEPDGDFVVAWTSVGQDGSLYGVYAQHYSAAGVPQGEEFRVNTYTTDTQRNPSVAMNDAGDFVIAWRSQGQDGSLSGVYGQLYDAAGVPQGGEFRANTHTTNDQIAASAAMDADGDFVISWRSHGQDGSDSGIYAQRYAIRPEVSASSFLFETAPHRAQFTFDRDVSASLGTDDIVLENLTTMQTIPSSDLSLAYDALTNTATFSYVGSGADAIQNVLPDGDYRATLIAAGISTPTGGFLPQDYVFNFFFLNGDANRDRRVNLNDFNILAANFGQSGTTFSQADFTYDGVTNLNDFNILAGRFGVALGPGGGDAFGGTRIGAGLDDADTADDVLVALLD